MQKVNLKMLIICLIAVMTLGFYMNNVRKFKEESNTVPEISEIIATDQDVKISWEKDNKCLMYKIYRKTKDENYRKIKTVTNTSTSYIDRDIKINETYSYKIIKTTLYGILHGEERAVTPVYMCAPLLKSVERYTSGTEENICLKWIGTGNRAVYLILRKEDGDEYKVIDNVVSDTSECSYVDKNVDSQKNYTYTVQRREEREQNLYQYGRFDKIGIYALQGKPDVSVDFTNSYSSIEWKKVEGVTQYIVYRKLGLSGTYKPIALVEDVNHYIDVYHDSFKEKAEKKRLIGKYFMDPSDNDIVYTVRAYNRQGSFKEYYGNYNQDGDFNTCAPAIVDVNRISETKVQIRWCKVENAQKYFVYSGYDDTDGNVKWEWLGEVKQKNRNLLTARFSVNKKHSFFTVKAEYRKNGKKIYSTFDKGFNLANQRYLDKKILFLGDSITFASPYRNSDVKYMFSYPNRINQLTGAEIYNPSIPGATYAYKPFDGKGYHRYRIVTDIAEKIYHGEKIDAPEDVDCENIGEHGFKDFDIIVMAAGTNDYYDNVKIGSLKSKKNSEFNGAVNIILSYIKNGNVQREKEGKEPIKVVFVDLFYSDRGYDVSKRVNRFEAENKIGLTLSDYQDALDALVEQHKSEGMNVYQFHTNEIVTKSNCPYVTSDNLHMTRFTYTQIGNELTEYLLKNEII